MNEADALPAPEPAGVSVQEEASSEVKALNAAIDGEPGANKEDKPAEAKPEKTPEERERLRADRKISRLIQQRAELRAQLESFRAQVPSQNSGQRDTTAQAPSDTETLQLSRAELAALVQAEAKKIAPSLKQQEAEIERRSAVVQKLERELGREKFDALASDLDDVFGGLADQRGRPKPATDAIFEADDPKAIVEYLADPENADEAEAIGRMSGPAAGRAIAKIEQRLEAKNAKPAPSKAKPPLEPVRANGAPPALSLVGLSDKEFAERRRRQIAARRM